MTWTSVLFPEPLGPMIAWTSPVLTTRLTPLRISLSPTAARRFLISSRGTTELLLSNAAFKTDPQQLLGLDRELHR